MATNEDVVNWLTEASGDGYSADTYNSRISNLQDRYTEAGVTDDQMRDAFGRNVYDDWTNQIRSGYSAAGTGFDKDMEGFNWDLGGSIPEYQKAEEYEDWDDATLGKYWGDANAAVNIDRDEAMDWLTGMQISPDDIDENYVNNYKRDNPANVALMEEDFKNTEGSAGFTEEQNKAWISDWINSKNNYTDYTVKPGEVGLLSDQMNTLLENDDDGVSRYIDRARTQALEDAGSRGMLGSSMAAGAAEGAAIDRAESIARGDVDVDKFNVGADTAAQTARFNAASAIGGQAQATLGGMRSAQTSMVTQMLLNKQAQGMALTAKEQDHLNALQAADEKQKDFLEGKEVDFNNTKDLEAQKNYYDVLGKQLDRELSNLSDKALYDHQAGLAKMERGSALYNGYMEGVAAILASNLESGPKQEQLNLLAERYATAGNALKTYKAADFTGINDIDFSKYAKDYDVPEGVLGNGMGGAGTGGELGDDVNNLPGDTFDPDMGDLAPTPPKTGKVVPIGSNPQPGDTVEGTFYPSLRDGKEIIDAEWLLAFKAAYPTKFATMMDGWTAAGHNNLDFDNNPGDLAIGQQWIYNYMETLGGIDSKGYSYTQPYPPGYTPPAAVQPPADTGGVDIPTTMPTNPKAGDSYRPSSSAGTLTYDGTSWLNKFNKKVNPDGTPIDEAEAPKYVASDIDDAWVLNYMKEDKASFDKMMAVYETQNEGYDMSNASDYAATQEWMANYLNGEQSVLPTKEAEATPSPTTKPYSPNYFFATEPNLKMEWGDQPVGQEELDWLRGLESYNIGGAFVGLGEAVDTAYAEFEKDFYTAYDQISLGLM